MIYRVVNQPKTLNVHAATTSRAPGNVPYYVDNVWEWLRPPSFPSRRRSAFASPTPELAALGAQGSAENAWSVELMAGQMAAQITRGDRPEDAKHHRDIARLKEIIHSGLQRKGWFDLPATGRQAEASLFLPCATAAEVDQTIQNSAWLDADQIREASTFWNDVEIFASSQQPPHRTGEIFFEGPYRLVPIQS